MCLIIVGKPKDIKSVDLDQAWKSNPDGAGIFCKSEIVKGIMDLKTLKSIIDSFPRSSTMVVHLRLATHGAPLPNNCHPFNVGVNDLLFHNGVLNHLGKAGHKGKSDSAELARILSKMPLNDRYALLKSLQGRYVYINEMRKIKLFGHFIHENNVHMSNTYWKPSIFTVKNDRMNINYFRD